MITTAGYRYDAAVRNTESRRLLHAQNRIFNAPDLGAGDVTYEEDLSMRPSFGWSQGAPSLAVEAMFRGSGATATHPLLRNRVEPLHEVCARLGPEAVTLRRADGPSRAPFQYYARITETNFPLRDREVSRSDILIHDPLAHVFPSAEAEPYFRQIRPEDSSAPGAAAPLVRSPPVILYR